MADGKFRFGRLHQWISEHLVPLARESRFSFVILSEAKDLCNLRRMAWALRSSKGAVSG
jgi:hypothetical protein